MTSLLRLFMDRHEAIEKKLARKDFAFALPAGPPMPIDLCDHATRIFGTVFDLGDHYFSSWVPGMPLPALLTARRRLTVDIAPVFLRHARRNFGISDTALCAFGRQKMLLFNIRDFDPTASEEDRIRAAAAYAPYDGLIRRLFEEAGDSIYFLAGLRHHLFDAVPGHRPKHAKRSLRAHFNDSAALTGAAAAAAALSDTDPAVLGILFRGERTSAIATRWHWAYVNSVAAFVPPEVMLDLQEKFARLADTTASDWVTGTLFLNLQNRLRYLHLLYSAPLSASFGGPYGFSLADDMAFLQAVQRNEANLFDFDYMPDRLLDLLHDIQIGRLRDDFRRLIGDRTWQLLSALGAATALRVGDEPYFDHYDDAANIAELTAYFEEDRTLIATYEGLEREMDGLLGDPQAIEPRHLLDLAARTAEAQAVQNGQLTKLTEGKQLLLKPSPSGFTDFPSLVTITNMKGVSLLWNAMRNVGKWATQAIPAVGGHGDYPRRGYDAATRFRSPPS